MEPLQPLWSRRQCVYQMESMLGDKKDVNGQGGILTRERPGNIKEPEKPHQEVDI